MARSPSSARCSPRCACARPRAPTRWSGAAARPSRPRSATTSAFGDDAVIVLVRGPLRKLVLTEDLERVIGLEGCIVGQRAGQRQAAGRRRTGRARSSQRTKPVQVVYGPGTFINEAVRQIQDEFTRAAAAERAAGRPRPTRRRASWRSRRGRSRRPRRRSWPSRPSSSSTAEFMRDALQLALHYGLTERARSSTTRTSSPRSSSTRASRRGDAQGALRLPVPDQQLGADPGAAASPDADATPARARDRADPRRRWRCPTGGCSNGGTYIVTGAPVVVTDLTTRSRARSSLLLVAALLVMAATLALVFRARLRLLPLGVALRGGGADLRRAGAGRRVADDGLDRRAAGADRPGGRLRDPVPVARPRGGRRRCERARACSARRRSPPPRAATAAGFLVLLLSPVPMVRGFGLLLVVGIVARAPACALTAGVGVLRCSPARRARRRRAARALRAPGELGRGGAAAPGAAARQPGRRGGCARRRAPRAGLAARGGPRPAPGARCVGRRAGRASAGRSTRRRRCETDIQKLVPQNLAGAARPPVAAADDRRGRRDRRHGRGRGPDRPEGRRLDDALPAAAAAPLRLQRQARLRRGDAVPGVLAARPVQRRRAARRRSAQIAGAARRRAALLLAGGDHARPQDGDAGLRHPADAARQAAARCIDDDAQPACTRRRA